MSDALEQMAELPAALTEFVPEPEKQEEAAKVEEKAPEVDPLIEKARASGWRPQDEYEGDPDAWVDAGEFVRRKPLFDQIHQLKKEVQNSKKQVEQVSSYAAKAAEKARAELLAELEAKKEEAFQAGDYRAFAEADKAHKQAEAEPAVQAEPEAPAIPPDLQSFVERNQTWFDKDRAMTVFAIDMTQEYLNNGTPYADALKKVESDVRREFAHKFVNPNKEKAPAVVAEGGEKRAEGKISYNDLSREERSVWASLKNHMTFEEFAKTLR